jgi:ABC-type transport system involved in multi-copper enzyme maturation permease subunit
MPAKLDSFPAYFALFKLTLRQLFWSRRGLLILIGGLLPLVIALVVRFYARRSGLVNSFIPNMTFLYYGFLTNLCAIFYGSAIVSDEIDGRGLTYLQMRPLRKSLILLSKFAAYMIGAVVLISISHLLLTGIMETHPKLKNRLLVIGMSFCYTGALSLGLLAYGAFAVLLSARYKHPVLWGLLFVFGWERITIIPLMPMGIKRISFTHYLMTIFPDFNLRRDMLDDLLGKTPPTVWIAVLVVCLLTVGTMWLAIRIFREREYLM